jgi:hypothetical protein
LLVTEFAGERLTLLAFFDFARFAILAPMMNTTVFGVNVRFTQFELERGRNRTSRKLTEDIEFVRPIHAQLPRQLFDIRSAVGRDSDGEEHEEAG